MIFSKSNIYLKILDIFRWLEKVTERMFNCFYHIDFIYKLTRQYKIHSEAIKDCYDMTSKAS